MEFNPDNQDFQGEQAWEGPRQSWMSQLVIKTGLAKDEAQANYVLIGIAVVFLILTVVIFAGVGGPNRNSQSTGLIENLPPEVRDQLPPEILTELQN